MGDMAMRAGGAMSMWTRMPGQTWPGFAASFLWMWMTMMVPMMVPPFLVTMRQYDGTFARAASRVRLVKPLLALGYFTVWSMGGVAILPLAFAASAFNAASLPLGAGSRITIGTIALITGIVQMSSRKHGRATTSRGVSRDVLLRGDSGAPLRRGIWLGLGCVERCGPLMVIVLATGIMDFRVMTAVTAIITAERLRRPMFALASARGL